MRKIISAVALTASVFSTVSCSDNDNDNGLDRTKERTWNVQLLNHVYDTRNDNSTSHCHFYLFYLVEKEKTELLVETIQHHHLIKCGPLFVDVLFFWGAQERVHIGRQTIITDVGKVMLSLAFIGYGQSS